MAELRNDGFDAIGFAARLDTEEGVAKLAGALDAASVSPGILINNAGMVSVTSAFMLTRALIPAMRTAGWGRIVNVSSVSGGVMAPRGDVA